MDQDNQGPTVFDINKPHTYGAAPSARPVITGHQPQVPDPMVTPSEDIGSKIDVKVDGGQRGGGVDADSLASSLFPRSEPASMNVKSSVAPGLMEGEPLQSPPFRPDGDSESAAQRAPYMPVSDLTGINTSSSPTPRLVGNEISDQQVTTEPKPGVFGSTSSRAMDESKPPMPHKKRSKVWLWLVLILVILAGLYAAIDKGLVLNSVNLPFHIFSKPESNTSSSQSSDTTAASSLPAGFTTTKLVEAGLSFAYPTDWGAPAAAVDQGFTKRTKDGKADAAHAYVVTFPNNKDIELAVTSSKILPPTRPAPLYYDFLGWCVGTIDGKYYSSALYFVTENNVDTPGTVACTQSLGAATKLNGDTIVQTNLKTTDGKAAGDIYTKNLTNNQNFAVIRAKDATMKNAERIKTMLGTVQNITSQ